MKLSKRAFDWISIVIIGVIRLVCMVGPIMLLKIVERSLRKAHDLPGVFSAIREVHLSTQQLLIALVSIAFLPLNFASMTIYRKLQIKYGFINEAGEELDSSGNAKSNEPEIPFLYEGQTFHVSLLPHVIVACVPLSFPLIFILASLKGLNWEWPLTVISLVFISFTFYLLSLGSKLKFNQDTITVTSLFSEQQLNWNDVDRIEVDARENLYFYVKGKKVLYVLAYSNWSGPQKVDARRLLATEMRKRKIDVDWHFG